MEIHLRRSLIFAALAGLSAAAPQDYRLRVTVNLVQVDATVTDAQGNPAPDLNASDFRVLLDGKPQEIKHCNYIRFSEAAKPPLAGIAPAIEAKAATAAQPAMPAELMHREDVRRTIVLFVGDLLTSAESMPGIRAGLKKFVQEQVRPGDLVAIVRSSAGLGALQDFTPDKRMLMAAIDQVGWTPHAIGIGGASAYEQIGQPTLAGFLSVDLAQLDKIDSTERATLATTASLLQVVRGMAELPGRKSVIFISDALRLTSQNEKNPIDGSTENGTGAFLGPIYESMRRVADESVRAGVVLYAIDARGLASLRAGAADRLDPGPSGPPPGGDWTRNMTEGRRAEYRNNQWGAMFISSQTGGFMITESNRIDAALERVMADQRGYYLLAFQPPAEAMHPDGKGSSPDFHRLKVEVLRPGLKVRSHAGFFGVGDEAGASAQPELQLSNSLESQVQTSGINLEVETSYLREKNDYFIRATLYIASKDVVFEGPPIHRTGVLRLMLRAFDAAGGTLEGGINQIRRIDLDEEGYQRAQKYGLIYTTLLPASKPGPYQVRASCQDEATGKTGAGGGFVAIPQSKGSGLQLSGIVFQHALGIDDHLALASGPSVYTAGESARFEFQIASGGPKVRAEQLEMRTRLFRDGVQVWESAAMPIETDAKKTASLFARGSLEVPKGLEAGKYMVRVDVGDKAQPDSVSAWQWAKLTLR
jgi:VWFA-related protein